MHFYCITRGIKHDVDRFINDCQAQSFLYPPHPPGEAKNYVQLAMRPMQFWEVVFPKQSLHDVLRIFEPQSKFTDNQAWVNKYALLMRKLLKLEPVPEYDTKLPKRLLYKKNVHVTGIGIKEDIDNPNNPREML